jgi:hypothetical protein
MYVLAHNVARVAVASLLYKGPMVNEWTDFSSFVPEN